VDISRVSDHEVRSSIAVVPQDVVLFNASLRYNLRYGNPNATDEDLQRALESSKLAKQVQSWETGLDTLVGERGLKLSGGEKQRVAIARAILKDAPILLCDEATSALDAETEAAVMEDLLHAAQGRTTLLVAHRLSTVRHADLIVVMDKGAVVEQGTHEDLLASGGKYSEMWNMQISDGDDAELIP